MHSLSMKVRELPIPIRLLKESMHCIGLTISLIRTCMTGIKRLMVGTDHLRLKVTARSQVSGEARVYSLMELVKGSWVIVGSWLPQPLLLNILTGLRNCLKTRSTPLKESSMSSFTSMACQYTLLLMINFPSLKARTPNIPTSERRRQLIPGDHKMGLGGCQSLKRRMQSSTKTIRTWMVVSHCKHYVS